MKSTVLGSRADGTVRTYLGGFRRWKRWASCNHVCLFPANPFQVAIYLQCLLQDAKSPSPVLNVVSLMVSASGKAQGSGRYPVTPKMLKALVVPKITLR